ncbi:molybdopterin-containing oxidoreductase family protein [Ancrocorticia sp.]|uniref:molybdopterin-containing oxidoreductase family protein n=1 Tax=Ancrocorticia sp. TaxID=2593684 RepID=UPI003F913F29
MGPQLMDAPSASAASEAGEKWVRTYCRPNCFGGCPLMAHVREGKVIGVSPAPLPDPKYNRVCLRGLTQPEQQYSARRILHPKKRVGPRGSGQWQEISWDEAIDMVVENFTAVKEQYGSSAIALTEGSGNYGTLSSSHFGAVRRLFAALDATVLSNTLDVAQAHGLMQVFGGLPNNDPADLANAKTIFIIGSNMTEAQIHTWHFVSDAKDKGAKVIVIDPIYTPTASKADQWVRIRPGSDPAMFLAMTRVVMDEGIMNEDFLRRSSVAPLLVREDTGQFLRASDLSRTLSDNEAEASDLDGSATGTAEDEADGVTSTDGLYSAGGPTVITDPFIVWSDSEDHAVELADGFMDTRLYGSFEVQGIKVRTALDLLWDAVDEWTLEKSEEVTTIPAQTLHDMAITLATETPASMYHAMGIDHWDNGHLSTFAESALACVTGNVSRKGSQLGFKWYFAENYDFVNWMMPDGHMARDIYTDDIFELANEGTIQGKPDAIKAMYASGCNPLGAYCDRNQWIDKVLPMLDFIVTADIYNSDTVEYSDLVLPACHWFERQDIQWAANHPFITWSDKAVEPLGESKPDVDIMRLLADRLGVKQYFPDSDDELINIAISDDWAKANNFDLQRLKEEGALQISYQDPSQPNICLGADGSYPTATGRAQFYNPNPTPRVQSSTSLHFDPVKERLPYFEPPIEAWPTSPTHEKYPLTFFQEHTRWRVHTQYSEVPMLRELDPDPTVRMSPGDAAARSIHTGDLVEIFNDRGHVVVTAIVSDALPDGMVSLPKGWLGHQHIAGAPSELTHMRLNPTSVNQSFFDVAVEVRHWKGERA